jgi:hypothetical protein
MAKRDASPKRKRSFESEFLLLRCHKAGQQLLFYCGAVLECDAPILEALFFSTSMAFVACGPNYSNGALMIAAAERTAGFYPRLERDGFRFRNILTGRTMSFALEHGGVSIRLDAHFVTSIHPTHRGPCFTITGMQPFQLEAELDEIIHRIVYSCSKWSMN